jgi:hypothetical protein
LRVDHKPVESPSSCHISNCSFAVIPWYSSGLLLPMFLSHI